MPPHFLWLFPVFFVAGCASMAYWLLGLIGEARSHPDRPLFRMRGINPFGGARGLVELAPVPRKRYMRAGVFWLAYFIVWAVMALSMSFWFMLPMVLLALPVPLWVAYTIMEARSLMSEADWRAGGDGGSNAAG